MANEKRLIDANKIRYHPSGFVKGNGYDSGLDWAFREDIDELPTVDAVEVVHGRWVSEYEYDFMSCEDVRTGFSCDKCGSYYKKRSNFCPNCGAKMKGE